MSKKTFDPEKVTVEALFRAKDEWRKEQAKLPYERKIEIVKKLQTLATQMRKTKRNSKVSEK
jgi:hypothetical protein